MASYLQIENISKSYGTKILFEHIGFNVNEGDKIALIAPNGTGKTSLLRILAGKDKSDSGGKILFLKDIRIAFLEQDYSFDPEKTIFRQIMDSSVEWTKDLDSEHLFAYERRVVQILTDFSLGEGERLMGDLSGGEVKRVAITEMLASEADFFIMDEPTNHLDVDAIEYLENILKRSRCTLLMVTHDRYFLDRVCNIVMEIDHGSVYSYKGDYENYLEKRTERIDLYNAETDKVRNVLRRELEWMHSTPCARSGKAKYRKNAFYALKDRAEDTYTVKSVDMSEMTRKGTYLGNKVIDCKDVSFYWGGKCYLDRFSYKFQRYERVGIVGKNASGKTTFLNLLTGGWNPSLGGELTGTIERGDSLIVGYYHQSGIQFKEDQTVLETVNDTHLLSMFLFSHDMLNTPVARLSGGEKRRLYLLTILKQEPNLLILDEPTNDLDIVTLNILEEYLMEYKGSLIIVSHDRHFLDRLVDHLFVFCGDGVVKDFVGGYSEYREYIKEVDAAKKASQKAIEKASKPDSVPLEKEKKKKLSWKEARELEALDKEIPELENEKASIEEKLSSGTLSSDEIIKASNRYSEIKALLDEKELRWLEL
ncbi:MAG: ABC-F family ATP-binding cassette domain-containing protein, partial [Bacteroidales bacterium]|nr:ABC-F family ATP-binding cassette domain-containing protein [Bacteroidales bacterium]